MGKFTVTALPLKDLKLLERHRLGDSRGYLSRMFCAEELSAAGWPETVAQINHTYTESAGTVRGMHFQHSPHAEFKLVSCIRGEVYDVVVDIRAGSETFLQVFSELLTPTNGKALLIPKGFAHGFQALTPDVEMLYCHSEFYAPNAESGLNPIDPSLGIQWPLPISNISNRDKTHPPITKDFKGFNFL